MSWLMQGNSGRLQYNCDQIPDGMFIDATLVRELCKIKLMTRQERRSMGAGCPDVQVQSILGGRKNITREELSRDYKLFNGQQVKMKFLRTDKQYNVFRLCEEDYKILKVPDNDIVSFRGQQRQSGGSFVICKANDNGTPDKSTLHVISAKIFRKAFVIPENEHIKGAVARRKAGIAQRRFNPYMCKPIRKHSSVMDIQPDIPASAFQNFSNNAGNNGVAGAKPMSRPVGNNMAGTAVMSDSKYRFTVTHQIMSVNDPNKQIGFVVKELSTGKVKNLPISSVVKLCESKVVDNVMIVTKQSTGLRFLKGNGIVLKNLPKVLN